MLPHPPGPGSGDASLQKCNESTLGAPRTLGDGEPPEADERRYLLVFESSSSWMYELPRSGEVVVGRFETADLRLSDPSVSRRHARIAMRAGAAYASDLGSQNGTRINGEGVTGERRLASGDVITVCATSLVFYSSARRVAARRAEDAQSFRQRLDEELERALRYRRSFTVVSAIGIAPSDRPQVTECLQTALRVVDRFAFQAASELCVLMPELGSDEAQREAERLVVLLRAIAPEVRVGFATCPGNGGDVDSVLAIARDAAAAARPGAAAGAAAALGTREIGDRSITVADPAMSRVWVLIERLAAAEMPVLVWGETGTGKELAAQAVHAWSPRREHRLVPVNAAALPDSLFESELFGYAKGAFTGAGATKPGLVEAAQGGTLFLDEVGEMGLGAQAKLLRVLETRRVTRIGEVHERAVDVRFVAATSRDLAAEVKAGRFRQDLFFRLSGATVWLPPLRDRKRELPILAQRLCAEASARAGRPVLTISDWAMRVLADYSFPGNVRELRNLIDVVVATVSEPVLQPWHLAGLLQGQGGDTPPPADEAPPEGATAHSVALPSQAFRPIEEELAELERRRMIEALDAARGNQTRAAELIHMPLRTFQTKVRLYDLRGDGRRRV
jgi:two-component system response regulator AtoC